MNPSKKKIKYSAVKLIKFQNELLELNLELNQPNMVLYQTYRFIRFKLNPHNFNPRKIDFLTIFRILLIK